MKPWQQGAALVAVVGVALAVQSLDLGTDGTAAPRPVEGTVVVESAALPVPDGPDVWTGRLVRVSDGDTVVVDVVEAGQDVDRAPGQEVKVRLLRIDTPELERPDQPLECWAEEATDALRELAPVGTILTFQYDQERVDRFGRDLAHAWLDDGTWVNGTMLAGGHARVVTFRPNVAHDDRVHDLEALARDRSLGLWGACPA